uniref:Acid ceramidase n=1 Tax=Astyanax mexicanus TaxID=7994 RepID=A0A8B9RL64_ASTMX
ERWTHVIKEKKAEVSNFFHGKLIDVVDKELPLMVDTLPPPFSQEIKGIAAVSGIPLGKVIYSEIAFPLNESSLTSTFITESDHTFISGNLYHARNMDFGLFMGWDIKNQTWTLTEKLKPLVVNVDFQRKSRTVFKSTGFAGYVGVLTGIRPKEFTLTMNERFDVDGGYIGILEWILGKRDGMWMSFLTRRVLENATSYKDAQTQLALTKLLAPAYFILGGNQTNQGCVITRTRINTLDIWEIDLRLNRWYVLETNYDHWEQPFFLDDRRTPAMKCMNKTTRANISLQTIYDVLSTKPVLNKLTTYTSLMEVSTGKLESYIRACPNPCTPW